MNTKAQDFFGNDDYFIDEKVAFLKFTNTYKVYKSNGEQIGAVKEKMPAGLKILSLFLNKAFFPFKLNIVNTEDEILATIKRGWTFVISKIEILDSDGNTIAHIRQKFKVLKPTFNILDAQQNLIAEIKGDWKAWNFSITDEKENQLGTITKKWAGILKEVFTTADKYIVSVKPGLAIDARKISIVAMAIAIDMVLKESK